MSSIVLVYPSERWIINWLLLYYLAYVIKAFEYPSIIVTNYTDVEKFLVLDSIPLSFH
jgi:hypothetical protein